MDRTIRHLKVRLVELGVDDATIGRFVAAYDDADDAAKSRFRGLGDRRLITFAKQFQRRRPRGQS